MPRTVGQRVAYLPQRSSLLFVLDFEIRHRGAQLRIPINEPLAAVDETVLVQTYEGLDDRFGQSRIHGEALAQPVAGCTQAPHLVGDRGSGVGLPCPDALDKALASKRRARRPFGAKLVFDHDLGGDAGMIGADLPEGVVAAHAVVANEHVHQRLLKSVPHVQRTGDVGRRKLDAIRRRVGLHRRLEQPARFPIRVPLALDSVRVEALGQFHRRMRASRLKAK